MFNPVIIGDCTLYCGDCVDILSGIDRVDAIVTSPPYDNLRTYEGRSFDWEKVIAPISSVLMDGGVLVWNVADAVINGSETGTSFRQALAFMDSGLRLHDTMLYVKSSANMPDSLRYDNAFEYVFILSKDSPKTFNPIKDKRNKYSGTSVHGTVRNRDGSMGECHAKGSGKLISEYGKRLNWWVINHEQDCVEHPATMPYKLADGHIRTWTQANDIVLDPFMGSGTTGVACAKMGRKFIGIEIEPKYFDIACKRIEDAYRQPDMFIEPPIKMTQEVLL